MSTNCRPNYPVLCPAPVPPWARPAAMQATQEQVLTGTSIAITAGPEKTFLCQSGPTIVNNMTLPNGNSPGQFKDILIPQTFIPTTATWIITGSFAGGFATLTLDNISFNTMLEWDGSAWQIVGGNGRLSP